MGPLRHQHDAAKSEAGCFVDEGIGREPGLSPGACVADGVENRCKSHCNRRLPVYSGRGGRALLPVQPPSTGRVTPVT